MIVCSPFYDISYSLTTSYVSCINLASTLSSYRLLQERINGGRARARALSVTTCRIEYFNLNHSHDIVYAVCVCACMPCVSIHHYVCTLFLPSQTHASKNLVRSQWTVFSCPLLTWACQEPWLVRMRSTTLSQIIQRRVDTVGIEQFAVFSPASPDDLIFNFIYLLPISMNIVLAGLRD